jgi:hypothetical protein
VLTRSTQGERNDRHRPNHSNETSPDGLFLLGSLLYRSRLVPRVGGYSVLNLLVVVAGFFLLITRQYPRALFDALMGINRWLYRVLTYLAFMHDAYPPFRLDQGQHEPHQLQPDRPAATPALVHTPA